MTRKLTPFSAWNERITSRIASATSRREHDDAIRDPRIAREHHAARRHALSRGERDCLYCK
jgi:hypothetical protein